MKRSPFRTAFTLIELLVVVAIIAILAGIAMVAYGAAMERAHATKCLANLRQLGQGITLYLQDNNDDFFSKAAGATTPWPQTLKNKYNITYKVMRSPFDKISAFRPDTETGTTIPVSYGLNDQAYDTNTGKWTSMSDLLIAAPAIDPGVDIKFSGTSSTNVALTAPAGAGGGANYGTHSNRTRINALFGDGHVETLKYADFANSSGDAGSARWNPLYERPTQ
jgi:prepilin-type N-terminal cleavage/methylation domain-containing protein/prepilin-type processing-associated H-X9-DG protein